MTDRILFVDDDTNLLASYKRQLRKEFVIETASEGKLGLDAIANQGPYAVVVSDLRMPGMDGIQFLRRVREISPDTVRIMLTGYADVKTAIEAVNEGNIFRLLTKPCAPEILIRALTAGIKQYQLVTAEQQLLEKTLTGSITLLSEVLSLVNPEAFGRASRVARYCRQIACKMGLSDVWQLETAAMLSQIGGVILKEETLKKIYRGLELTKEEEELFERQFSVASNLIGRIPRMEKIAEIIAYQDKRLSDSRRGDQVPLESRIIKLALDFDILEMTGLSKKKALDALKQRIGTYDVTALVALQSVIELERKYQVRSVMVSELREGMIFADTMKHAQGTLLAEKGQPVSQILKERLVRLSQSEGIPQPIRVILPQEN